MTRVATQGLTAVAGSELELERLVLEPGAAHTLGTERADRLLYVTTGGGALALDGQSACRPGTAVLVSAGEQLALTAGPGGLQGDLFSVGPECDLHAPMGQRQTLVDTDHADHRAATGKRSFQILFDGTNGSARATLFVGHIPPGAAPWHYHLYDEIVCVLAGSGRLHLGDEREPLAAGSAFRLSPRELHIVENTSGDAPLVVLGLFTPAGSPSAAYLPGGVARYAEP
ncbi:MAG: cupin domain-containing protein [Gaiella sp.]